MNLVIPYRHSLWNGEEMRYALRGYVKHLKFNDVVVVGDKPYWANDKIIHIDKYDDPDPIRKERNIHVKTLLGMLPGEKEILFANDDIFMMKDFDPIPNFAGGNLPRFKEPLIHVHRRAIRNTVAYLDEAQLPILNFDVHTPIVYNCRDYKNIMEQLDWDIPCGYAIKSIYGNTMGLKASAFTDMKIATPSSTYLIRRKTMMREIFSISDKAVCRALLTVLKGLYPEPTIYER